MFCACYLFIYLFFPWKWVIYSTSGEVWPRYHLAIARLPHLEDKARKKSQKLWTGNYAKDIAVVL